MPAHRKVERDTAIAAGNTRYFTGVPCSNGHLAERWVSNNGCVGCAETFRLRYRDEAARYIREKRKRMLAEDPEGTREMWSAQRRKERERDPERVRARERKNGAIKRARHPQRKLAETRKRQAELINRTPPWADLKAIRQFYENCPVGMVVDHVIPLRGKYVSGLHVLENLQYLTQDDNLKKGNRYVPELMRERTNG